MKSIRINCSGVVYFDQNLSAEHSKRWSKSYFFHALCRCLQDLDAKISKKRQTAFFGLISKRWSTTDLTGEINCVNQHSGINPKNAYLCLIFYHFASKSCKNMQQTWNKEISNSACSTKHPYAGWNIQRWWTIDWNCQWKKQIWPDKIYFWYKS